MYEQSSGQYLVVGGEEVIKAIEGLADRLEAIGIQPGIISENEKMPEALHTLYQKMFPQQYFSEVLVNNYFLYTRWAQQITSNGKRLN